MIKGHWKYISPKTWELITRIEGKEVNSTADPKKIAKHLKQFKTVPPSKDQIKG